MKREQALAKNTVILMFGKICTQSISFLLLPLYTSLLDTTEYGTFDLMITYSTLLLPLVNWQFDQGLFRFILDKRGNNAEIKKTFSTIFVSCILQTIIYIFVLCIINLIHPIQNVLFLLLYVSLHVFVGLFLQFSRGIGKSTIYSFASFLSATTTVVFNVITLAVLHLGLRGLFIASIMGQVVTIGFLVYKNRIWRYFSCKEIQINIFKKVSQYSLPLIPNNLAWWVVNASDRMVIKHFLGLAVNGIYTVSCKFPNVFINFYNIVNLSWTESVSLHFNDEDRDFYLSKMMTLFFRLFASGCYLIIACMPFVFPLLVNVRYAESYNQIYILMMAMLFRVMVGLYSCVYIAEKKSKKVASTSIAAACINLGVDVLLITHIGLYAASISTLVAFSSMFVIRYFDINRSIHMKIEPKTLLTFLGLGVVLGGVYYCRNIIIQLIGLLVVCIIAVISNRDVLLGTCNYIMKMFKRLKAGEK